MFNINFISMKKILFWVFIFVFSVCSTYSYSWALKDYEKINLITNKIEKIITKKWEKYRNKYIEALEKVKKNKSDKIIYLIEGVINELSSKLQHKIIQIVDWDTIKVEYNWTWVTVRILWIDTPEKFETRTWYKECYWDESSDFAVNTLSWKLVYIVTDYTQDKFDKYWRLLAHIRLLDWTLYENLAIKNWYWFYYLYNIPTKYDEEYKKSEEDAKNNNLWVWKYCEGKRKPIENNNQINNTWIINESVPILNNFSCNTPKTFCTEMKSCEEAKFYLNSCSIWRLDGNKDGVPCESLCQ